MNLGQNNIQHIQVHSKERAVEEFSTRSEKIMNKIV